MRHGVCETDRTTTRSVQRRADELAGSGAVPAVLLGLQRSAGNAAVAGRLGQSHGHLAAAVPLSFVQPFVQRCGPTPCNCSADERAEYAEKHPDQSVSPEGDTADVAGDGHDHG